MKQIENTSTNSLIYATGPLEYRLTNDYLFRALLQRNNRVLKALICALLHLMIDEVLSVTIENPIELGKSIDSKYFVLDIRVLLNNNTIINLEMQVMDYANWPERSLSYLCRSFDSLETGEDYLDVKPVIHISFLDFTLFEEYPEFYATYMLMNVKNHSIYSDKLRLSVVELNQMELATEEDKAFQIDYWAALFKAKTWEDIKMLAEKNEYLNEASETIYQLSAEEQIREQCRAREEYYRIERTMQHQMENITKAYDDVTKAYADLENQLAEKDAIIAQLQAQLEQKQE